MLEIADDAPTWLVTCAADLATKPGPLLVKLHNALAPEGTEVKKFETRMHGADRLFRLINGDNPKDSAPTAEPAAAPTALPSNVEKEAEMAKTKKPKKVKTVRVKAVRVAKAPKDRSYKAKVVSKGGEKAMGSALELIKRANGATAQEIADKLEVSLGTAKNLVWYLRRDGKKIVVDKTKDRKPYVID